MTAAPHSKRSPHHHAHQQHRTSSVGSSMHRNSSSSRLPNQFKKVNDSGAFYFCHWMTAASIAIPLFAFTVHMAYQHNLYNDIIETTQTTGGGVKRQFLEKQLKIVAHIRARNLVGATFLSALTIAGVTGVVLRCPALIVTYVLLGIALWIDLLITFTSDYPDWHVTIYLLPLFAAVFFICPLHVYSLYYHGGVWRRCCVGDLDDCFACGCGGGYDSGDNDDCDNNNNNRHGGSKSAGSSPQHLHKHHNCCIHPDHHHQHHCESR